jgi:hypothetical protein
MHPSNQTSAVIALSEVLLNLLWIVLWIILALITAAFIASTIQPERAQQVLTFPIHFELTETGVLHVSETVDREVTIRRAEGRLKFQDRIPFGLRAYNYGAYLAAILLTLFILYMLRRMLSSLRGGSPFIRVNGKRLRWIGAAVIGLGLAKAAFTIPANLFLTARLDIPGIHPKYLVGIDGEYILIGLLILVLAEIFRVGAEMREEQELTV